MEIKIQDLVSSIKKDGIDAASERAKEIIADAQKQADEIIKRAKEEQQKTLEQTKHEIDVLKQSAIVSTEQAKRDAVLLFEQAVKARFEKILAADVQKTVKGETLAVLIKAAMNGENARDYIAEVAEVTDGLKAELKNEIQNGLEIKISPDVKTGFRLCAKDGSGYFDCSDDEIANMLAPFFPEIDF